MVVLCIVNIRDRKAVAHASIGICLGTLQTESLCIYVKMNSIDRISDGLASLFITSCLGKLVEDMEIALIFDLTNNSTLLQQIVGNLGSYWFPSLVKHNFQVFSL